MGGYFSTVICAHRIGANFIRVQKQIAGEEATILSQFMAKYIPPLIASSGVTGTHLEDGCPSFYGDWENKDSTLFKNPEVYQLLLRSAFEQYTRQELVGDHEIASVRYWKASTFFDFDGASGSVMESATADKDKLLP